MAVSDAAAELAGVAEPLLVVFTLATGVVVLDAAATFVVAVADMAIEVDFEKIPLAEVDAELDADAVEEEPEPDPEPPAMTSGPGMS